MNRQHPAMRPTRDADEHGPAAGFATLCEEIDQLFQDLALPGRITSVPPPFDGAMLVPPAALVENPHHYELAVELPGLECEDIMVELAGVVLTVAAEKRPQSKEQSGDCLMNERRYGELCRRFSLPQDIDPDRIEARYHHGLLKVSVGRDAAAESRVRTITVV